MDRDKGTTGFFGDGNWSVEVTSVEDTARVIARVVLGPDVPASTSAIVGDCVSFRRAGEMVRRPLVDDGAAVAYMPGSMAARVSGPCKRTIGPGLPPPGPPMPPGKPPPADVLPACHGLTCPIRWRRGGIAGRRRVAERTRDPVRADRRDTFPPTRATETTMQIDRDGAMPSAQAPERSFTGDVRISGYFRRAAPSRLAGATVTFAPGARTPWKVNPLGQTLIVTNGAGWAQAEGEDAVEIRAGDRIWCPPGQRHWEGATPDQAMTYVAMQEEPDGAGVQFGAAVTDEEYRKGQSAPSRR